MSFAGVLPVPLKAARRDPDRDLARGIEGAAEFVTRVGHTSHCYQLWYQLLIQTTIRFRKDGVITERVAMTRNCLRLLLLEPCC